jgi:hypothetical protein
LAAVIVAKLASAAAAQQPVPPGLTASILERMDRRLDELHGRFTAGLVEIQGTQKEMQNTQREVLGLVGVLENRVIVLEGRLQGLEGRLQAQEAKPAPDVKDFRAEMERERERLAKLVASSKPVAVPDPNTLIAVSPKKEPEVVRMSDRPPVRVNDRPAEPPPVGNPVVYYQPPVYYQPAPCIPQPCVVYRRW